MQKTILYLLLLLSSTAFLSACHRQLARVQPTPQVRYERVVTMDETTSTESYPAKTSELPSEPTSVFTTSNQSDEYAAPVPGNDAVASTKFVESSNLRLAKKVIAIQQLLKKHQTVSKKPLSVERKKHPKRVAEDTKGTLGLLGLIFSSAGLLLILVGSGIGLLFTIAGFVLSILGLKGPRRGMAIAGLVISGIMLLLFLLVIALIASFGFV